MLRTRIMGTIQRLFIKRRECFFSKTPAGLPWWSSLPMQGMWVQSLGQEDSTSHRAPGPRDHSYWVGTWPSASCNYWSLRAWDLSSASEALQWDARAPQLGAAPLGATGESRLERHSQPKNKAPCVLGAQASRAGTWLLGSLAWALRGTRPTLGFPGGSDGKASACNAGGLGSIPGWGRSPGEGNGNPLQHSCLENPMDSGAW